MTTPDISVLRADLKALSAYHVPPATGMVKLDAMENPFPLPDALQASLGELLGSAAINRYPDPTASELKAALRRAFHLDTRWEILFGNGSDEIIQLLIQAIAQPGATVLSVEPSFVMYRMVAAYNGVRHVGVPLEADFSLNLEAVKAAIAEHRPAITFLAYPNNPTGNLFDKDALLDIIRAAAPGLVVIDEAYGPFAADHFLPQLADFSNLLVMRTLSKLGLAGLRLGYLLGHPAWVHEIDKLRLPYNINVLTQLAATRVLEHHAVLEEQTRILRDERAKLFTALESFPGVTPYPSEANFITARVPDAPLLHEGLKKAGILVKNLHGAHPLLAHCLRFTVGAPAENALLLNTLQRLL